MEPHSSKKIKDSPKIVETEDVPILTLSQRKRFFANDSSNEELRFDDGTSPPRDEDERRSFIPAMLGDSKQAEKLAEAY